MSTSMSSPHRNRTRPLFWACLAVALTLLPGCFTFETIIRIQRDGSGTIVQEFVLQGPMLEMMVMFAGESEEPPEPCNVRELEAQAKDLGEGVRLASTEPIEEEGRMGCRAMFTFDDVNELRLSQSPRSQLPASMTAEDETETETEPASFVTFSFEPGSPASLVMHIPQEFEGEFIPSQDEIVPQADAPADSTQQAQQIAMMREIMRGGHVLLAVEVDGDVTASNAEHRDGNRVVIMEMDFDTFLSDEEKIKALMNAKPQSVEEARALLQATPGIRVETNREIRVNFN